MITSIHSTILCFVIVAAVTTVCLPGLQGPPTFKKITIKKGNKVNFPLPGDTVLCYYTGKLENGKVFDTNSEMRAG